MVYEGRRWTDSGSSPNHEALRRGAFAVLAGRVSDAVREDASEAEALVELIDSMTLLEVHGADGRTRGEASRGSLRSEVMDGIGGEAWDERFPGRSPLGADAR